ncbi:probable transmembrane ascorbate ferrireductase 4 isoform X1 [Coffea arabica]|uniref:Probable transmembrane ascorbate ferrireductase 4 isoform X1 n=1 Tax=Coffea arabica TaxID=13443 RepID=A0A6P6UY35_COFAR
MVSVPFSSLFLQVSARLSACIVALLVVIWALYFKTSFIPRSSSQEDLIYAILHPLLMVIGFILVSGEGNANSVDGICFCGARNAFNCWFSNILLSFSAILVHRWLPGSRNLKKSVHLCLQGLALGSGVFGIWTKFHSQEGIVANFYSLHSWMGLICITLFGAQWLLGFLNFWHKGEVRTTRVRVLPWHVFLGLYTYALAVVTAETGLLEKLTFLQTRGDVLRRCTESMVVNGLGLGLALLSGIVILAAVSPKHGAPHFKMMYTNNKWLSSQ